MPLLKFNVQNLSEVDGGRLSLAIEKQIRRCVDDCRDRPGLDTTRKVVIELAMTPYVDETADLTHVTLDYQVKTSLPALKKEGLSLGVQKNGDLVFSPDSPRNVDQGTLLDEHQ